MCTGVLSTNARKCKKRCVLINKCINSVVYFTFIAKLTVHEMDCLREETVGCIMRGRSGAQCSVGLVRASWG